MREKVLDDTARTHQETYPSLPLEESWSDSDEKSKTFNVMVDTLRASTGNGRAVRVIFGYSESLQRPQKLHIDLAPQEAFPSLRIRTRSSRFAQNSVDPNALWWWQ